MAIEDVSWVGFHGPCRRCKTVVVEARVMDSTHLELRQPIDTPAGGKVVISVVDPAGEGKEREEWLSLSLAALSSAYGDSEPTYTDAMVKEPNPEFRP